MSRILVFCFVLFGSISFSAQTSADIIEMNLKARGGKEKIQSLKNMVMECVSNRQGMEFPLKLTFAHKVGFRMDMQIMGMDCFTLVNSKAAYSFFPMRGQAKPEAMPEAMHKSMLARLDLHGDFIDYEAKGISYAVMPEEKVDEKLCYVLLSKNKEGKEKTIFISKESKLVVKEITKAEVEGEEREFVSTYSDFKLVDGFLLPTTLSSPMNGDMTVTKYSINSDVKPELFELKN
jgi:hypothetical protein